MGDNTIKKKLLLRALTIQENFYGKNHILTARTLMLMGNACGALGEHTDSESFLMKALAIQEEYYGQEHREVAITLMNLGNVCLLLKSPASVSHLERALRIKQKLYDANHVEIGITLTNLGIAYLCFGNIKESENSLTKAVQILEMHYGKDHPQVALALNNLADFYLKLNQLVEAKRYSERACQIFLTHPESGPQHPNTQVAQKLLKDINQRFSVSSLLEHAMAIAATEDAELRQALLLSKQLNFSTLSANASPMTTFFQSSSSVDEWQQQIQTKTI